MKKSEIMVGRIYTNGKGAYRKVLSAGSNFPLFSGQFDHDTLRYAQVIERKAGLIRGDNSNITRASFASWAKSELRPETAACEVIDAVMSQVLLSKNT